MANVNQEIGRAAPYNQQIALNDTVVRTLFGKASGVISMSDGYGKTYVPYGTSVSFTADTTWTVPAGVTSVKIKAWGGGGGNKGQGSGTSAGGGGYITGILSVTPGSTLSVFVSNTGGSVGGITEDCGIPEGMTDISFGGYGAYVYRDTSTYIVSGGGGGSYSVNGGAGGGTNGLPAAATSISGQGAQGNTGGARATGNPTNSCNSTTGQNGKNYVAWTNSSSYAQGGEPGAIDACSGTSCERVGATGGSGWAGGGGSVYFDGAGGGASSGATANFTSITNTAGSGGTPGNNGDSDYVAGKGVGATDVTILGGAGYIVIRY